jgi:hypothetical protein
VLAWIVVNRPAATEHVAFDNFLQRVDSGEITAVVIRNDTIVATTKTKGSLETDLPLGVNVIPRLMDHKVAVDVEAGSSRSPWVGMLAFYTSTILPWFTLGLVLVALARVRSIEKRLEAFVERVQGSEPRKS